MTYSEQLFAAQRAGLDSALEQRAWLCDRRATEPGPEDEPGPWGADPAALDAEGA